MANVIPQLTKGSLFNLMMAFWCCYSMFLYIRKKKRTFLYFSILFFIYLILTFYYFPVGNGYNLILFVILAIIALVASYKELEEAEKEGKSAAQFLNLDKWDIFLGIILYMIYTTIKIRSGK